MAYILDKNQRPNQDIRETAKESGVYLWQIAAALGISEPTLIRWLRFPLAPEKRSAIIEAIEGIEQIGRTGVCI